MLTQERLKELLHYDPSTGLFTWLRRPSNRVRAGDTAGHWNATLGYVLVRVDGVLHYAHRLAHLYMEGCWPEHEVDHYNRVRHDNRWENLVPATKAENQQNLGLAHNNKSGYRGVSYHRAAGKWVAERRVAGTKHYLGLFTTAEDARDAWVRFSTARGLKV